MQNFKFSSLSMLSSLINLGIPNYQYIGFWAFWKSPIIDFHLVTKMIIGNKKPKKQNIHIRNIGDNMGTTPIIPSNTLETQYWNKCHLLLVQWKDLALKILKTKVGDILKLPKLESKLHVEFSTLKTLNPCSIPWNSVWTEANKRMAINGN